ncbi:DUF1836 domain-containing protein [Lachnospiraceae bacterium JLR.KK009]|nr:hypothetical protein C810_01932 [Lachnospiraceae bacterium A2]MCI8705194.1 DUF1836 domain-containing protein [Lachnospiraceae bacterium]MCI8881675.1 DUF1836 domain-containing protein [Lachnospiraceae bacterium]
MTIDEKDLLNSILESLARIDYIKPEELPNIDLYMDQVTTFMDDRLSISKRHPEDKVLTKTMINNYAKNNLLPPPVKKKYSKEHLLALIFIYYFKNILSIGDIQAILNPITDRYFASDKECNLEEIYSEVFRLEESEIKNLQKDITRKYHTSQQTFPGAPKEEQDDLQHFSFLCMLSFDVYVKKQLIEKIIDARIAETSKAPEKRTKK